MNAPKNICEQIAQVNEVEKHYDYSEFIMLAYKVGCYDAMRWANEHRYEFAQGQTNGFTPEGE